MKYQIMLNPKVTEEGTKVVKWHIAKVDDNNEKETVVLTIAAEKVDTPYFEGVEDHGTKLWHDCLMREIAEDETVIEGAILACRGLNWDLCHRIQRDLGGMAKLVTWDIEYKQTCDNAIKSAFASIEGEGPTSKEDFFHVLGA